MDILELIGKMSIELKELEKKVISLTCDNLEEYIDTLELEVNEDGTIVGKDVKIWDFLATL